MCPETIHWSGLISQTVPFCGPEKGQQFLTSQITPLRLRSKWLTPHELDHEMLPSIQTGWTSQVIN